MKVRRESSTDSALDPRTEVNSDKPERTQPFLEVHGTSK